MKKWRSGQNLPTEQGLVLGCKGKKGELTAFVDSDDIHCLMIGASGIGKTAYFLYPNLEYVCASGPRPSSIQRAMTATAARTLSSTMRRKGFSLRSS